ncbi:hypothetical protein Q1695_016144 [Nippostrongylus brasiliensis]|nr:hypothetical protein Q1695_016144 [Nippostrongylus brasiliensis]
MSHQEKQKNFQEQINRRVLVNWVRITGYQSKRKGLDSILEELSNEVLGYPKDQGKAFSWPAPAGVSDGVPAYRPQRPAVLAVKLNVDLSEWNGSALEDLLTNSEKEAIKAGQLRYGSMQLQGISIEKPKTSEILSATEVVHLKETETCPTESQSQKRKRTLEEFMDVQVAKKHVRED